MMLRKWLKAAATTHPTDQVIAFYMHLLSTMYWNSLFMTTLLTY
jgi:hypothetical protein